MHMSLIRLSDISDTSVFLILKTYKYDSFNVRLVLKLKEKYNDQKKSDQFVDFSFVKRSRN